MGIKLKNDGTYSVSYHKRDPITRQPVGAKRIKVKSKAEAKRIYAELILQVDAKIKEKVIPKWIDFLPIYIEHLKTKGMLSTTIYGRERNLIAHTVPIWGSKLIDEIKTSDIYDLLHQKFASNAESHRKFILKCIRGIFAYALEKGYVARNPTPVIKFKTNEKIKSVLNEEQIVTLLRKAQQLEWKWYPHYAVALFTGMRNGELYALTWDKVNLDQRQILVDCSWNQMNGLKSTKSGDDRIVEIPNPLLPLLLELKMKSSSNFVLPRIPNWDKGEQARELRFFLASVGLPQIRFHDLRASWATLLLSKGVPPSQVMSMGGWRDMKTMMIYMRKAGINIKDSTKVLDEMITHGFNGGQVVDFRRS